MTKDYSNCRDPEFAIIMYEYFEIQAERCKEIDKMMKEMEEAPEQLDLFKEYND